MNQHRVLLDLPDEMYERVRQIAEDSRRPVENILLESLVLLFGESPLTPQQIETFSDAQLWAVVHRPLAWPLDARLRELTARSKRGDLTQDEQTELERLVDQVDNYILLRSKALLLLKERGHDIETRLKLGA